MAIYAVGDVQGCYAELALLLEDISPMQFEQNWFAAQLKIAA